MESPVNGNRAAFKRTPSVVKCIAVACKVIARRLKPLERGKELRQLMLLHGVSRHGDSAFYALNRDC